MTILLIIGLICSTIICGAITLLTALISHTEFGISERLHGYCFATIAAFCAIGTAANITAIIRLIVGAP